LQQGDGDFARLNNPPQAIMTHPEMERLFLQHRSHTARQGRKSRMAEHAQLVFAVPVDKLRKGKEVKPGLDRLVKRSEEPLLVEGATLQQLLCFQAAGTPEMCHQQVTHLVTMAHLFRHYPCQATQVILAGCRVVQMALLLDRGKLCVALVDNVVEEGIADALIGDVAHRLPAARPSIIPKGNFLTRQVVILGCKGKARSIAAVQTDVVLPGAKCRYPVIEGSNGHGHESVPLAGISFATLLLSHTTKAWHPLLNVSA